VPLGIWFAYGTYRGEPLPQLLGFHVIETTSSGALESGTLSNLLTWITAYLAYAVLFAVMTWVPALLWFLETRREFGRRKELSTRSAFVVTALLLTVGYVALAIQHSLGAGYNIPTPSHLMGRYLIHLSPILIALGMLAITRIIASPLPLRGFRVWIPTAAVLAVAWTSWWILFKGGIWGLPAWGASCRSMQSRYSCCLTP